MEDNNAQKKTLMAALDNLMVQRENLTDLSRRSDTMREKMKRTEDHPKDDCKETMQIRSVSDLPDIVDLFNNVTQQIRLSVEDIRTNINITIDLID